jgi:hypothetical protein
MGRRGLAQKLKKLYAKLRQSSQILPDFRKKG